MSTESINLAELAEFVAAASAATFAGNGKETKAQRPDFHEFLFDDGEWNYRDSYTGWYRSRGMEVVRLDGRIVWATCYGGGMETGLEEMAGETFTFLKQALSQKPTEWHSFRGPNVLESGEWRYTYEQVGNIEEFVGHEQIFFAGKRVFFHQISGGVVR